LIDHAIILVLSLILIVGVSLQGVLLTLPLFQRVAFDAVCHRALMQMDQAGGMNDSICLFLENSLVQAGYTGIAIHGDSGVPFGCEMTLHVEADLSMRSLTTDLQMQTKSKKFIYHNSILNRFLATAADPAG
jgi:hypothetical protein